MSYHYGFLVETMVSILLLLTILYCVRLNKQLRLLKADERSLRSEVLYQLGRLAAARQTGLRPPRLLHHFQPPLYPTMKNNKDTAAHTPKELLTEMHALVAEAQAMMVDSVSEHTQEAVDALRSRFADAQERFADVYAGARKKVIAGAKYTDETIRENPYQSIAIAAGIGLLVGVLLGRRSK